MWRQGEPGNEANISVQSVFTCNLHVTCVSFILLIASYIEIYSILPFQAELVKLCKDGCTAELGVFKSLLDQGADPNIKDLEVCLLYYVVINFGMSVAMATMILLRSSYNTRQMLTWRLIQ